MIWPFKRKPKHVGPTSVDWRPGDWCECVVGGRFRNPTVDDPVAGEQFMVADVLYGGDGAFTCFCLKLIGRAAAAYDSRAFRKITLTDTGADRKVGKHKPVEVDA